MIMHFSVVANFRFREELPYDIPRRIATANRTWHQTYVIHIYIHSIVPFWWDVTGTTSVIGFKRDIRYTLARCVVAPKSNIFTYWSISSKLKVNKAMDVNEDFGMFCWSYESEVYMLTDVSLYSLGTRLCWVILLHAVLRQPFRFC